MTRPTAIDVFGGCGGSGIGFRRVGFDILAAIENGPVGLVLRGEPGIGKTALVEEIRARAERIA